MIKISEVVQNILDNDDDARIALKYGVFSITNYAKKIKSRVDEELFKDVGLKSIVVTLHRIVRDYRGLQSKSSPIRLQNISIHPNLSEITYERTKQNFSYIGKVSKVISEHHDAFFTMTNSVNEITIVVEDKLVGEIKNQFKSNPVLFLEKLTGVTVKFGSEYLDQPNLIYELTKRLALNGVNIIEIVSTVTELTYIVNKSDSEKTVSLLSKFI